MSNKSYHTISKYNKKELCIILCTTPDNISAKKIAKNLLQKKLAACITFLPNITSLYYWNNVIEQKKEVQLLIKSYITLQHIIFKNIKKYHPYQIPELLTLPIVNCDNNYLLWINKSLSINTK